MVGSARLFPLVCALVLAAGCGGGSASSDDSITLACPTLIAPWTPGVHYAAGDLVSFGGGVYQCQQANTAQANWGPNTLSAQWKTVRCSDGSDDNGASGAAGSGNGNADGSGDMTGRGGAPGHGGAGGIGGAGGGGGSVGGGGGSVGSGGGTHFRSPVFFMPLDNSPQSLPDAIAQSGEKDFLFAFVLDSGGCTPAWNGDAGKTVAADTQMLALVSAVRAAGGDVGISFGGYNGTELGQTCGSPQALAAAYQAVIDKYQLVHIDLDVENGALGDLANEQKRFAAIKILEDNAAAAGRKLSVSLTVPMTTVGFPDTGRAQIAAAVAANARIDIFNIMDFDFGLSGTDMASACTTVAEAVHAQLKALYPSWSDADVYAHTGLQMMNGHTDQPSELMTQDTFRALLAYATAHHLGWVSYWAMNRDRPCDPSVPHNWADGTCSSVTQTPYEFTKIVAGYGG